MKVPSACLVVVALATGLVLASKHTGILVFPMLLLLGICEVALRGSAAETGIAAVDVLVGWVDHLEKKLAAE